MGKAFIIFSIGQIVTTLGNALTAFAMAIWIYQNTDSVATYTLGMVFFTLPGAILSPFLGILVDRYDPKKLALLAESIVAASTAVLLILLLSDQLNTEIIFAMGVLFSISGVMKYATLATIVPFLVSKEYLTKANGLLSMSAALAQTIAPLLAGFLLLMIGLEGILSLNLITFLLGSFSFIAIFTSSRKIVANEEKPSVTNVSDVFLVFKYFRTSVYQAGFIIYLAVQNFIISMVAILTLPLMMALFAETELGIMMTFTSFGALVGGALIFILTPKKLVKTILICNFILGVLVAILGTSVWLPLMLICGFSITLFGPLIDSCEKSYWQLNIPKNMLGRFFSFRAAVDLCSFPAAAVISGIIVDQIFAPGMLPGGSLVPFFGDIIGVGEGRGIGVIFFLAGAIYALIAIIVLSMKRRTTQVMNTLTEV